MIEAVVEKAAETGIAMSETPKFSNQLFNKLLEQKGIAINDVADTEINGKAEAETVGGNLFEKLLEKMGADKGGESDALSKDISVLTDEQKKDVKEKTDWSDEIIENIQNMKQYEILKNASLKEVEINGRKCLVKENFDPDYVDEDGNSNRDKIGRGLSPIDNDGNKIYLHHLGQKVDSPLVELTFAEHRQGGNDTIWHDKNIETEVYGEGNTWNSDRKEYWLEREKQFDGGNS